MQKKMDGLNKKRKKGDKRIVTKKLLVGAHVNLSHLLGAP
jgi:hypothetical protein